MRRTKSAVALTLVLLAESSIGTAQQQANRSSARQAGQAIHQQYDSSTGATFSAERDSAGNALLTVKAGDFLLEKVLAASGDMTLRLTQGKDVVTIALNQNGYQVARGKRSARFDPRAPQIHELDAIRAVFLGSPAVRSFRRLSAALEARDDQKEDGLLLSALVDGALVHMLDGDPGATKRIGKRIALRRQSGAQLAKVKVADSFRDCVGMYEIALIGAWDFYYWCWLEAQSYSWWSRDSVAMLCEFEWLVRTQQYVWQFVSCLALPRA
jgi:hypothetical protein